MDSDERTGQFLDAATAGLSDDPELRLDVRGELASHIEETAEARVAGGDSEEEARAHALKAFGELTDVAAEFVDANRSRMRHRARIRLALRALLAPAAVVVAALAIRPSVLDLLPALNALGNDGLWAGDSPEAMLLRGRKPTPEQRLILCGDPARGTMAQQQRAIWEASPENKTFAGNYVTALLAGYGQLGGTDEERFQVFAKELAAVTELDPENARYDYLLAAKKLDLACTVKADPAGKDDDGKTLYDHRLDTRDRACLDEAMATLKAALRKQRFQRYSREILHERLLILGSPRTRFQQISMISMCASTLLPDLGELRALTRASILYGELLVTEGRPQDAEPLLDAWKTMALHLNDDSFTLIDVLVVGALPKMALKMVPPVYETAGNAGKAAKTRQEAAALAAPVTGWRDKSRESRPDEDRLLRSASVLHLLLLPAVGEWPTDAELAPGRYLDYVNLEQAVASGVTIFLLAAMVACAVVALRWGLDRRCASAPILLLPSWRVMACALGLGVLVPVAAYFLLSRYSPVALRQYAIRNAWPFFAAEMVVLTVLILGVPSVVAWRAIRERCRALGLEHGGRRFRFVRLLTPLLAGATVLGVVVVCVATERTGNPPLPAVAVLLVAALVVLVSAALPALRALGLLPGTLATGFRTGTVARSLIPVFASAIILFSLLTRPYLDHRETWLVQNDPLMRMDAGKPGFTAVEVRVTERLQKAVAEAAKGLDGG